MAMYIELRNHSKIEDLAYLVDALMTGLVWNFTARCLFLIFYISVMTKILLSKLQNRRYVARNHILFTKFVPITEMFLFMCFNDLFCTYSPEGSQREVLVRFLKLIHYSWLTKIIDMVNIWCFSGLYIDLRHNIYPKYDLKTMK